MCGGVLYSEICVLTRWLERTLNVFGFIMLVGRSRKVSGLCRERKTHNGGIYMYLSFFVHSLVFDVCVSLYHGHFKEHITR